MERIKDALERARSERIGKGIGFGGSPQVFSMPTAHENIGSIQYTHTKSVETSKAFLRERRVVAGFDQGPFTDAYKLLSTQVLQKMREQDWNVLAVTSPGENEGKTLTAINLAISLAQEVDQTVLLVDADLRHPSVHDYFGFRGGLGLGDYLQSDEPLEQMLIHPNIGGFVILPGGKPLHNSSEMLRSPKMVQLVQELKSRYPSRVVIFDLPPLLSAADALAFAPYIDAALLVVEEGKTETDDITRAAGLLGATHLIGTVLNKSLSLAAPIKKRGWLKRMLTRKGH